MVVMGLTRADRTMQWGALSTVQSAICVMSGSGNVMGDMGLSSGGGEPFRSPVMTKK